ncbi:MAG: hypothetical protein V2A59_03350 [Candidatus Omnitrophota bacterium]
MTTSTEKIDRYCAFTGSTCGKILPDEDDLKIFFVYPSMPRIKGYIKDICNHKELAGINLFPWENLSDTGGILFCKICSHILESHAIVADITYVNQNVLFELGFGIANGKIPILIKEESRSSNIIDILKDVKRIDYSDIDALVGRLGRAFFEEFPYSELSDITETPSVFFINADANMPVKRPIYKYLEENCRDLLLKLQIDDSSEILSHKLVNLLRAINNSELIVCHMVGTDYKGYDEINAQVAFLAGYALGKQKKILILQEHPSDRMIDLQQVRCVYRDRREAIQLLESWLKPIKEAKLKNLESEKKSKEHLVLKKQLSLVLGHPAAEYDSNLDNCFIETDDYLEARRLTSDLFIGRRGTGKTANFLQLSQDFKRHPRNIVVEIVPSKLQLISTIDNLYSKAGNERVIALFEMFWQYLILTEIAIQCQKYEANSTFVIDPQSFLDVTKLLEEHINTYVEFDIRFNDMIDKFCNLALQSKTNDLRAVILQNFYKQYFPKMQNAIIKISEHHPIIVLIDNLDKDWDTKNITSISALVNSLFDVMNKISVNHLFGDCNVISFLRTDIYQISSKYDSDFDKRQPKSLIWDAGSLKAVICERIASAKGIVKGEYDELWQSVFGNNVGLIGNVFDYIIKRTMLRPRDILTFCSYILDNLNKSEKTVVDEQIIYESEKLYSEYLLRSLRQEYRIGYPDIDDICNEVFFERNATFTESQLREKFANYIISKSGYGIDDIIEFCFKCGLLGIECDNIAYFEYEGRDYNFLISQARKNPKGFYFVTHPGLYKFLEIRS